MTEGLGIEQRLIRYKKNLSIMHKYYIVLIGIFLNNNLFAQNTSIKTYPITIQPWLNGQLLKLDDGATDLKKTPLTIEALRFYISNLTFYKDNKEVFAEKDSYHLVDAEAKSSLKINVTLPVEVDFDRLQFHLGIDSLTNDGGVMGGDLDPTKGMYWSWNTGYINFKLEGRSINCPARFNSFQFHLGGFLAGQDCLQTIQIADVQKDQAIIKFDISEFLKNIDLSTDYQIMSPGERAKQLSETAAKAFSHETSK